MGDGHQRGVLAIPPGTMRLLLVGGLTALLIGWVVGVARAQSGGSSGTERVIAKSDKTTSAQDPKTEKKSSKRSSRDDKGDAGESAGASVVPEPKHAGGEPDGIVQVANLVYAGTKSSKCFSDNFLVRAEKESAISTSRRFHAVKLSSDELFEYPLVIMTGEGSFRLPDRERDNLRKYVERGGFLLASAGCSSEPWDRAFRAEMAKIFPEQTLQSIDMGHAVFHTVYDIASLKAKHGKPRPLEGITLDGRIGVLYSQDGLNDTAHAQGCCCCGGNELTNANEINVNILAYALVY